MCESVCVSVSGTCGLVFTKFSVQHPCGRGLVLLWRRWDTLCTSGFMNDVTFGRMALGGWPDRIGVAVSYVRDRGRV